MSDLAFHNGLVPAIPAPRGLGARWWAATVRFFTVADTITSVDTDDRRRPRHYPERNSFLESAAMRREMDRL